MLTLSHDRTLRAVRRAAAGLLIAGLCGGAVACGDAADDKQATIPLPTLTGKTLSQAERELESAGFEWTLDESDGGEIYAKASASSAGANATLAGEKVERQDPPAGKQVADDKTDIVFLDVGKP